MMTNLPKNRLAYAGGHLRGCQQWSGGLEQFEAVNPGQEPTDAKAAADRAGDLNIKKQPKPTRIGRDGKELLGDSKETKPSP